MRIIEEDEIGGGRVDVVWNSWATETCTRGKVRRCELRCGARNEYVRGVNFYLQNRDGSVLVVCE